MRVTLVRRLDDVWPETGRANAVYSRYELRVQEVFAGIASPGETLIVYLEGGLKARWGDPTARGGFKPRPGEETVDAELPWWPRFVPGREELVFLARRPLASPEGEPVLFAPGDGRYKVVNGRVVSLYVDIPQDPNLLPANDYRREIIGSTVPELRARLASLKTP